MITFYLIIERVTIEGILKFLINNDLWLTLLVLIESIKKTWELAVANELVSGVGFNFSTNAKSGS